MVKVKLCILLIIVFLVGCSTPNIVSESPISENNIVEKIEVYHFHGENQCFSCRTIKEFAEKTVNTHYQDLLESGKMEFRSINLDKFENKDVTAKYGATGSSLWIGTYVNGEFHKKENTNVWYKVNDEEAFVSSLKTLLDKRLSGDLK